ncbi:MAG: hypothetical protein IJ583_14790 [Firmicutes bacterium]|nr:hypothetical protein [Bacillota bacterium]
MLAKGVTIDWNGIRGIHIFDKNDPTVMSNPDVFGYIQDFIERIGETKNMSDIESITISAYSRENYFVEFNGMYLC